MSVRIRFQQNRESGKRDSNPRPQPWQGCALPTELFPHERAEPFRTATSLRTCSEPASSPCGRGAREVHGDGGEGDRTPDLVNAIHALSQLSYAPAIFSHPSELPAPDAVAAAARKRSRRPSERQA